MSSRAARVLIVEDDEAIAEVVQRILRIDGYKTEIASDGAAGLALAASFDPDIVILDLGLPQIDGTEVARRLREAGDVPILVLTARDAVPDRIRGLDLGADDYVVKPVDLHELGARLRSLVRRAHGQLQDALRWGPVLLEPAARQVSLHGAAVPLSTREFDLLQVLMLNAGRVLSREQLEQQLYSWGHEVDSNAIEVHIHHLRRKLQPELIQTLRGVGYTVPRQTAPA